MHAAATEIHRQRRICRSVVTLMRITAYRPRNFQSTSAYSRSSEVICSWRTAIHSSGTTELHTASSTIEASTAPILSRGSRPVRSPTMPRAPSATPAIRTIASFGRSAGIAEPRLIPAVSGVSPTIRKAPNAGHRHTQAMSPRSSSAARAYSGAKVLAAPTTAAPTRIGPRNQRPDGRPSRGHSRPQGVDVVPTRSAPRVVPSRAPASTINALRRCRPGGGAAGRARRRAIQAQGTATRLAAPGTRRLRPGQLRVFRPVGRTIRRASAGW